MSNGTLTLATQDEGLSNWLTRDDIRDRIGGALCGLMSPESFIAQIIFALQDPKFAGCSNRSKCEAAMKLATLGLLPSLQHAALIPRKAGNGMNIDVMPQWQGWKAIMLRVPEIRDIKADIVHSGDKYYFDEDGDFHHDYDPFDAKRIFNSTKDIKGGYCRIYFRDGRPVQYHFITAEYVEKCRGCAQTKNVWDKWFESMALKTVYRSLWSRRVINYDPVTEQRLAAASEADDQALQNIPTGPVAPPKRLSDLSNEIIPHDPQGVDPPAPEEESRPYDKPSHYSHEETSRPQGETSFDQTPEDDFAASALVDAMAAKFEDCKNQRDVDERNTIAKQHEPAKHHAALDIAAANRKAAIKAGRGSGASNA